MSFANSRARRLCPTTGAGVHRYIFDEALRCKSQGFSTSEAAVLIGDAVAGCGRVVTPREIDSAVQRAFQIAAPPSAAGVKNNAVAAVQAPKWPALDKVKVAEVIATGHSLVDLWEASPVRIEDNASHTENVIDQLFPGNPLLCCGKSAYSFDTKTREEWRGALSALQLIVPSPMSKLTGTTKEGKESAHCLDNTGHRRFLVCEFDSGTTDDHAAILLHLARRAPLVMAVHSGGKSLHGWFYCADRTEEQLRQ